MRKVKEGVGVRKCCAQITTVGGNPGPLMKACKWELS